MQDVKVNVKTFEEDEIDLKELFKTIWKKRLLIVVITFIITILAIVYAYLKTPIYQVKSNIQIGFIGNAEGEQNLLDNPDAIVKKLSIIFEVQADDKVKTEDKFISEVSSISQNKKVKNYIEIKTEAISNEEALKKNKEVLDYLQNQYKGKIDLYTRNIINQIEDIKIEIRNISDFEIKNIEHELKVLERQKLTSSQKRIDVIKNQDIKKLEQKIVQVNEQQIVEINNKINFLQVTTLNSIDKKIDFHSKKLNEYTNSIEKIYKDMKENSNDSASNTIASIQMVNYQNLILNSQNKIEDLKISKEKIQNETVPNLIRKIKNLKEITIRDLKLQIQNLKDITLVNLEKEKENLKNDTLRKLKYKIDVTLANKKIKLEQKIQNLNYNISKQNMQNSSLVGNYIVKDYPVKPKKKLIVVVAFVTGLILSIFLVFFLEFAKGFKKEDFEN